MNFHASETEEDVHINLTPLIDVVFLLLIFFMVSTTFDTTSQLKIRLPEADQEKQQKPPRKLTLTIDADGKFFLNSRELANAKSATLKAALENAMQGGKKLAVLIQSDAQSPVQALVTAMDVVGKLGLPQVSIATTKPFE
jgi:biopolymer transport protein ExbD